MENPVTVAARLTGATASTSPGPMENPATIAARLTGATALTSPDATSVITTAFGHPLPSVEHALQVDGRVVSSDSFLFEKQQTFNRAKTLERMVHPCGSGAFGHFEVTHDVSKLTKAAFLSSVGKKTPVFTRFSTVTFGREFPDSGRNPRGFAVKFYTEEGNYDLVGLNWPIFFVRDPLKGPDVIRSQQRDPQSFLLNFEATFEFLAANPEAMHAGAMFFSDSATPVGWRHMDGFGCHTFKWVNETGEHVFVKYHWLPAAGKKNFTFDQAQRMCGVDPDFAKRDLFEHLAAGKTAEWSLAVQLMTQQEADACAYDPFDVTKVWSHQDFPLHPVGKMVLDKNPENYHRDVEQAAFAPGNLVPGVEPSPDLLLNWRMFFYRDAQYHRLGVNHHQIPVNCPFMAKFVSPQSRDGVARADLNGGKLPPMAAALPSHRQQVMPERSDYQPVPVRGMSIQRGKSSRHEGTDSELDQVRQFVRAALDDEGRDHLYYNTAKCLRLCSDAVRDAYLEMLEKIDASYRQGVERALDAVKQAPKAADLLEQVTKETSSKPPTVTESVERVEMPTSIKTP